MSFVKKNIYGSESYVIANSQIELAVTMQCGYMAPVIFYKDAPKPMSPYFINPWQFEERGLEDRQLKMLRGDFFCMPCGLPKTFREEGFPIHGETASGEWMHEEYIEEDDKIYLQLYMDAQLRKGRVRKIISLREGQNAVYIKHEISGYDGVYSLGHHATLALPEKEGSVSVTTSPIHFGYTHPVNPDEYMSGGEYYFLEAAQRFESLEKVPTIWKLKPYVDCTRHPVTTGFSGLVQVYNKVEKNPAWVCAYYPEEGFVWYALKNPKILPSTVFWMENKGRHLNPWNGRTRCLGLEDNCVAFGDEEINGELRRDLENNGICYEHRLLVNQKLTVNYIQGVQMLPNGFGSIKDILFNKNGITMISKNGNKIDVEVEWQYLFE